MNKTFQNFGEYLYYAYANLQMLHYALKDGKPRYDRMCYMIRYDRYLVRVIFKDLEIWHSRVPNLSWTHFRTMLRVADERAQICAR